MPTPREQARTRTIADITRLGREHLAEHGAAGLSLRAIARDLGVVSSAVYRYVPSRDDLLTLLVVDAYAELGEAVTRAESDAPRTDLQARWRALAGAVRGWALAEPSRYGLVFGTPVPGYHAPAEQTTVPGTRVVALLLQLAADAEAAGCRPASSAGPVEPSLHADAERVRAELEVDVSDAMLTATVLVWVALFGAVSFEVFGQYGKDTFAQPEVLFAALVDLLAGVLGIGPT
ncbi:TetR/AcrR family transcriptional regulator [Rhodococcus sp. X156]|uniref:TetR/AcrR family transcriptional regulator n=1 Tax=Rhodococcus sp. X156 TaxID=2499145 RepID=UPI000FDABC37|nr:TetR/AcrR family transcriptional regulator [Rhodococcus sp. X156]